MSEKEFKDLAKKNNAVAGCIIKKSTPKSDVEVAAKKCISMYLTTNYFTV